MQKNQKNQKTDQSAEKKLLIVLSVLFVGVLAGSWFYALNLKQTIAASQSVQKAASEALVEIEKLRLLGESQINNSLNFFLLGSPALLDEQKKDKEAFSESLEKFQKEHSLSGTEEIINKLSSVQNQQQEIFDQAMEHRAKQTESKIVGQFYRSKTNPLKEQINKSLNEIIALQNSEVENDRASAQAAASEAEARLPRLMTWLTGLTALLFFSVVLLVLKMLKERSRHIADRARLYDEAQKANLSRDELSAAITEDLKQPLQKISQAAEDMRGALEPAQIEEGLELIQSSVSMIDGHIKDIIDEAKAAQGHMTLRLDQLPIDAVLDDARRMLQPIAKQKDIRLEFNSVNPPALAFMDRERVMRVLANVVGNAIKFSPRNSKVSVRVRGDQQFVYISVKDNGPGIPEKQRDEIFTEFWQASATADQGAGVGLAIVKTIIEAHGGTVTVDSNNGNGATFTFSLPKRRPAGAHIGKTVGSTVRISKPQSEAGAN